MSFVRHVDLGGRSPPRSPPWRRRRWRSARVPVGERLTVTWKGLPQTRGVGNANVSVQTPGWILRGTALSRHRVRGGARPHPLPVGEARERGVRLSGAAGFFLAWPSWMLHRCRPVLTRRFVSRAAGRRSNPGAFPQVAETEPPVQCLAVPRQCPPVSGSVRLQGSDLRYASRRSDSWRALPSRR